MKTNPTAAQTPPMTALSSELCPNLSENVRSSGKLTPAQLQAMSMWLTTGDIKTTAAAARVNERTIRRWLAEPAFQAALRESEDLVLKTVVRRLTGLAEKSIRFMETLVDKESASDSVRLRAASEVLNQCLHWRERCLIEERLVALEQHMEESKGVYR